MQNTIVSLFASALLFSTPSLNPSVLIPRVEPGEIQARGAMVLVKPEQKLQYLLDQCGSLDDIKELAKSFDAVAKLYDEQSNHSDAEICYFVAIRLMNLYLPIRAPELAVEYARLSAHYCLANQGELARQANLVAIQIYKANIPECAVELAITEHNQAWLELYVGRRKAAEHYLSQCLKLLKSTLGEKHLLVGLISSSLGELYMSDGNFEGAERLISTALEILPQYADTEEVTNFVRSNYALVLERLGTKSEKVVRAKIK